MHTPSGQNKPMCTATRVNAVVWRAIVRGGARPEVTYMH